MSQRRTGAKDAQGCAIDPTVRETALRVARRSGAYLLDEFRRDSATEVLRASAKNVTVRHDQSSDRLIVEDIMVTHPGHMILSEESEHGVAASTHAWLIDPLDGSRNFANHNPFFSVSIAALRGTELEVGVVFAPYLDELFLAERGGGTTCNARPISVSATDDLAVAYVVACDGRSAIRRFVDVGTRIQEAVLDFRKLGSAAIECALVACGRADAFLALDVDPWDVAAGALCVREAGGMVTTLDGRPWPPTRGDVLMSNGRIHERLLRLITAGS